MVLIKGGDFMKKIAGAIGVLVLTIAGMLFSAPIKFFVDLPTLIFVGIIGAIIVFVAPYKKGKAFIDAAWLVFAIGLVAGMISLTSDATVASACMNIAVSAIALIYGYLVGTLYDLVTEKSE